MALIKHVNRRQPENRRRRLHKVLVAVFFASVFVVIVNRDTSSISATGAPLNISGTTAKDPPQSNLSINAGAHLQQSRPASTDSIVKVEQPLSPPQDGGASQLFGQLVRFPISDTEIVDAVYALPTEMAPDQWKGVALLLHGCSHSAFKFFSPHPQYCPECIGLPEQVRVAKTALQRGYVTLAISSIDQRSGCWHPSRDIPRVQQVLERFRMMLERTQWNVGFDYGSKFLRHVVAIGASSGGHFAGVLVSKRIISGGALIMISSLDGASKQRLMVDLNDGAHRGNHGKNDVFSPPIYFAPMPMDERTAMSVQGDIEDFNDKLRANNVQRSRLADTEESVSRQGHKIDSPFFMDISSCLPIQFDAAFLHERVPSLSLSNAEQIISALATGGEIRKVDSDQATQTSGGAVLDDTRALYQLAESPRHSGWWKTLVDGCSKSGCLGNAGTMQTMKPALMEIFQRVWGFHEYCSESVSPGLGFIQEWNGD